MIEETRCELSFFLLHLTTPVLHPLTFPWLLDNLKKRERSPVTEVATDSQSGEKPRPSGPTTANKWVNVGNLRRVLSSSNPADEEHRVAVTSRTVTARSWLRAAGHREGSRAPTEAATFPWVSPSLPPTALWAPAIFCFRHSPIRASRQRKRKTQRIKRKA